MSEKNNSLPVQPDSETASWLRAFLCPILEQAKDWQNLRTALTQRGYKVAFRGGHMIIAYADTDRAICTGQHIGTPLRSLVARFGRPSIAMHQGGESGDLAG
jgi:hypothetical protein